MKEIKFRAWDKDKNQMVFPNRFVLVSGVIDSVYVDTDAGVNDEGILFKRMDRIKNFVLMQFTGLKDKNGKEIYEGDVVKHRNGIQKVEYYDDCYSFQMGLSDCVLDQEGGSDENIIVIGNIYKNPELLK